MLEKLHRALQLRSSVDWPNSSWTAQLESTPSVQRCLRHCLWPSAPEEASSRLAAEVKPQCGCCCRDSRPPTRLLAKSKVKFSGTLLGSWHLRVLCLPPSRTLEPAHGEAVVNEGKQHPTGVTVMDSKLTLGSASEGCVHEVTSLKPARWAVMERLPDQFQHVLSLSFSYSHSWAS